MKRRIIWCDDDLFFFKSTVEELEELYDVHITRNADEFWRKLTSHDQNYFSGVIMDVILPHGEIVSAKQSENGERTGLVLLEMLKSSGSFSALPVVLLSIRDNHDIDAMAKTHRVPVFQKAGVRIAELIETVRKSFGE
jgi:hypothetical protein